MCVVSLFFVVNNFRFLYKLRLLCKGRLSFLCLLSCLSLRLLSLILLLLGGLLRLEVSCLVDLGDAVLDCLHPRNHVLHMPRIALNQVRLLPKPIQLLLNVNLSVRLIISSSQVVRHLDRIDMLTHLLDLLVVRGNLFILQLVDLQVLSNDGPVLLIHLSIVLLLLNQLKDSL